MHRKSASGFTLIELLVVIAIVGILSVILIVLINPQKKFQQARDSQRANDISIIKTAIDSYNTLQHKPPNCTGMASCPISFSINGGDPLSLTLLNGNYLKSIPPAPVSDTGANVCDYHIYLYPENQNYYNLRWCYETWTQNTVANLPDNGTKYYCAWDNVENMAVCFTGTDYNIPTP